MKRKGGIPFRGSFIGKSNTRAPGDSPLALSAPNTLTCCRAREVDCGASPISADFVAGPCKAGTRPDAHLCNGPDASIRAIAALLADRSIFARRGDAGMTVWENGGHPGDTETALSVRPVNQSGFRVRVIRQRRLPAGRAAFRGIGCRTVFRRRNTPRRNIDRGRIRRPYSPRPDAGGESASASVRSSSGPSPLSRGTSGISASSLRRIRPSQTRMRK